MGMESQEREYVFSTEEAEEESFGELLAFQHLGCVAEDHDGSEKGVLPEVSQLVLFDLGVLPED